MKTLISELTVFLKDADLVATTAFLTLTGKMGYGEALLGLKRFDFFRFTLGYEDGEDPERVIESLTRVLASQSTFFNRNKHYHNLFCSWSDTSVARGTDLETARRKLGIEVSKSIENKRDRKLRVQSGSEEIILKGDTVFLAKLLVQEREDGGKKSLSNKLRSELGGRSIDVTDRGVLWWLALRARDGSEAERLLEEISVTVKRDRGLLVNPHYQSYSVLAVSEMDLNNV